jgi:two-component system chemotaxis response regulator CheB
MAKVLIVEDSRFVRRVVCDALTKRLSVSCDEAENVKEALLKIKLYPYEVILLDYILPDGTGIDVLHQGKPLIKGNVVLFSSLAQEGADITVQALSEGAVDFILKPGWGNMLGEEFITDLVSKVGSLLPQRELGHVTKIMDTDVLSGVEHHGDADFVDYSVSTNGIIVVASSTGGPAALRTFISKFKRMSVPIVIAQHMPPLFTKSLAEQLGKICGLNVMEAEKTIQLSSNMVYIIAGGKHGIVDGENLEIIDGPPVNGVKPAADLLFASAAESYGKQTLGVVLTGMGKDGLEGCKVVKDKGGKIIAQSENTSVVWGMPGEVVKNGLADYVDDIENLPFLVEKVVKSWK